MRWVSQSLAGMMAMITVPARRLSSEVELGWRLFEVPDLGTSVQYPADIFTSVGRVEKGTGERFESADGRAVLSIYSVPNEAGETPASF
jgi:hypothetical protein